LTLYGRYSVEANRQAQQSAKSNLAQRFGRKIGDLQIKIRKNALISLFMHLFLTHIRPCTPKYNALLVNLS